MTTTLNQPYLNAPRPVAPPTLPTGFLSPFDEIAAQSDYLIAKPLVEFEHVGLQRAPGVPPGGRQPTSSDPRAGEQFHPAGRRGHVAERHQIPRYVFLGPRGGGDTIRLGIFATIHGDEPEGALGLVRFLHALEKNPDLAKGYALFIYPLCNPTGFEDRTRHSRAGVDLNREFWINSDHPEVRALETEIWTHAFHGIVTLHSDDTSDGLYGFVNGAVLSEYLLEPALRSAETFLPRNKRGTIDGFPANRGIINSCYNGVLKSPHGLAHPPFEITFETPQRLALHLQVEAVNAALHSILGEYRTIISVAQNI